jgi:voltage-gated potassium channel
MDTRRSIDKDIYAKIYERFAIAGILLAGIIIIGTIGYRVLGGDEYSLFDSLYMTIITISTIGYSEIIDLSANPAGRVFTIFIALGGIGVLFYVLSNFTALFVEGEISESFRRKKMEKNIGKLTDHYIVCGVGRVGRHIVHELHSTKRPCVIIEPHRDTLAGVLDLLDNQVYVEGAATEDHTLKKAGIERARGLFAVAGDDNTNLVIALTARGLNPKIKIVARCTLLDNIEKMKKAGADSVISPNFIGGLRMASEMIRPNVVSFLDTMLRDKEKNLRVEEITVPPKFVGKQVAELNLKQLKQTLLLAIKTSVKGDWIHAPSDDYTLKESDTLIFMASLTEKGRLDKYFEA